MDTQPVSPERLSSSVIAVPPLARRSDLTVDAAQNKRMIRYLEAGGVSILLYGGNAVFYHIALSEYRKVLQLLENAAARGTLVIPSAGPTYGAMMDHAEILRDFPFPTAMLLPQKEVSTSSGIGQGVRNFVDRCGKPAVLYIKHDRYVDVDVVRGLMNDGLISWIKYAVVRDDPAEDRYLSEIVEAVGPQRIVSGIGEQPAIVHMTNFGLAGFTSGCVCVAPRLSMDLLAAVKQGNLQRAEEIRETFRPLEDLRNGINPIRVLHAAVELAEIAETGPLIPLLSDVDAGDKPAIQAAALELKGREAAAVGS